MIKKIKIMVCIVLLIIQIIYGQLTWKSFAFYEITDSIKNNDTTSQIKVYTVPLSITEPENIDSVDFEYSVPIDDTRFSEYIMAALSHARSFQKIQHGTYTNHFEVYRFYPYIESRRMQNPMSSHPNIYPQRSSLHSFGIGKNSSGDILLDVWTTRWKDSYYPELNPTIINKYEFVLKANTKHMQKVKFDYMIAALINYNDETYVNRRDEFYYTFIEIIKDNNNNPIGIRFHSYKENLPVRK